MGNTVILRETALIEAFNLKAAIEYVLKNMEAAKEALSDMPPRCVLCGHTCPYQPNNKVLWPVPTSLIARLFGLCLTCVCVRGGGGCCAPCALARSTPGGPRSQTKYFLYWGEGEGSDSLPFCEHNVVVVCFGGMAGLRRSWIPLRCTIRYDPKGGHLRCAACYVLTTLAS